MCVLPSPPRFPSYHLPPPRFSSSSNILDPWSTHHPSIHLTQGGTQPTAHPLLYFIGSDTHGLFFFCKVFDDERINHIWYYSHKYPTTLVLRELFWGPFVNNRWEFIVLFSLTFPLLASLNNLIQIIYQPLEMELF